MRGYYKGHRTGKASEGDGYTLIKNNYSTDDCNVNNTNCDWFTGTWSGYVIGKAFSNASLSQSATSFVPRSQSDIRCASETFLAALRCDNGYDVETGQLIMYCVVWPAKAIFLVPYSGFVELNQFDVQLTIQSFKNGIRFWDPTHTILYCIPMDRSDTDTFFFQFPDNFTGPPVNPQCMANNTSPNLQTYCVAPGAGVNPSLVGTSQYAFLLRQRPSSLVEVPFLPAFPSDDYDDGDLAAIIICSVFGLLLLLLLAFLFFARGGGSQNFIGTGPSMWRENPDG